MSESPARSPVIVVAVLSDPLVEAFGFTAGSRYVEICWLPVLGPTATWLYRRLAAVTAGQDEPVKIDLAELGRGLGVGAGTGRHSVVVRALERLVRFDVVRIQRGHLLVRRVLGPLPQRQLARLPEAIVRAHHRLLAQAPKQ